ncbi:nonstructural protein 3 [Galliform chaphamaparvovirus 11]|nr:nonstructural protein 3 [Galliform chaphamaparvovirus 11]
MTTGFTILLWVKPDSPLLGNTAPNQQHALNVREEIERSLLSDACCLLSVRWQMECSVKQTEGTLYAFGYNNRFNVSQQTVLNALGKLSQHLDFIRSGSTTTFEDLSRYRECREKWNVPEDVTTSSYGLEQSGPPETSRAVKRLRF